VSVLFRMERKGVLVDRDHAPDPELGARGANAGAAGAGSRRAVVRSSDSPKQLQEILFGKLEFRDSARPHRPAVYSKLSKLAATYPLPN